MSPEHSKEPDKSLVELIPQATFVLSPEAWAEFEAALEAPPKPNEALRKLMQSPSVFDEHFTQ